MDKKRKHYLVLASHIMQFGVPAILLTTVALFFHFINQSEYQLLVTGIIGFLASLDFAIKYDNPSNSKE